MKTADRKRKPGESRQLDSLWGALGEPTRRRILDLLRERPRTTGEVAAEFPASRFAVMKHLKVLEAAGLVVVRRQGRERWNHLNAVPLQLLYERWVKPYEAHWAGRLTDLKARMEGAGMATASMVAQVELEIGIAAAPEKVWKALIADTSFWWPKDFYTSPRAKGFHIEPKLGGSMYEDWGNGEGLVWFRVFGIGAPELLELEGCMSPPYGPAHTLLKLELKPAGKGTVLRVSDSTIGISGHSDSKEEGWRRIFDAGLKEYVESGTKRRSTKMVK
jgi:DNA-binding transcriptional ArsR family regulator/uncharacterized protein YndB with AHSA1/START domain